MFFGIVSSLSRVLNIHFYLIDTCNCKLLRLFQANFKPRIFCKIFLSFYSILYSLEIKFYFSSFPRDSYILAYNIIFHILIYLLLVYWSSKGRLSLFSCFQQHQTWRICIIYDYKMLIKCTMLRTTVYIWMADPLLHIPQSLASSIINTSHLFLISLGYIVHARLTV